MAVRAVGAGLGETGRGPGRSVAARAGWDGSRGGTVGQAACGLASNFGEWGAVPASGRDLPAAAGSAIGLRSGSAAGRGVTLMPGPASARSASRLRGRASARSLLAAMIFGVRDTGLAFTTQLLGGLEGALDRTRTAVGQR